MIGSFGTLTDTPATLVIQGARLIDPSSGTDTVTDVAVVDGLVAEAAATDAEVVDGRGLVVAPGFCDLHTHLREPGGSGAETIDSGARAAAHGGYTTVCAMPNTEPPLDAAGAIESVVQAAMSAACRVRVTAAATVGRAGTEAADLDALAAVGAVGFSDDGASVASAGAEEVFRRAAATGLPIIEHAEDPARAAGGVMRAGPTATKLGLAPWPPEAELAVVERDLEIAARTGARLHLTHLSTAASVEAVRAARARGANVTCDVTPHHLAMADDWVAGNRTWAWEDREDGARGAAAYDGSCRVNPPLASRADARALLAGIADGTIDAIATDHAPHPPERKLVPFADAAPGLIGLETALSLGLAAVEAGLLELPTLIAALSTRPAAIIGESRGFVVRGPAELVLFDPTARWRVEEHALASASSNTPLLGMELPGVVRLTIADGRVTYRS